MVEVLFVLVFAAVLVVTGITAFGVLLALLAGFVIMALAGMVGVLFKLLPWLLAVWFVVWLVRDKDNGNSRCNGYRRQYYKTSRRYRDY